MSKQEEAHCRNLFSGRIMEVARIVSLHQSYRLITPQLLDKIFIHRCRSIKMIADKSSKLDSNELQEIKNRVVSYLKSHLFEFKNTGHKLSLYDWAGPGLSLYVYLEYLKDNHPEKYPQLIMAFEDFLNYKELWQEIQKNIYKITNFVGLELGSPDKRMLSFHVTSKLSEAFPQYVYIEVSVKEHQPEVTHIDFDGNIRPAFRVAIFCNWQEPQWLNLEAGKIGLKDLPADKSIPVYIQSHALKRLDERLDCAYTALVHSFLITSLEEGPYIWYNNNLLIEFRFDIVKIGYLLVDMVGKKAIIRTFLLLTHFDTPEGDKLHKLFGFAKPDIEYLNLDKLSTFVSSDFGEKSVLRDLLSRAGCDSLFGLDKRLFRKGNSVSMAAYIESCVAKYEEYNEQFELNEQLSA